MNSANLFQAGASSVQVDVVLHGKYMLCLNDTVEQIVRVRQSTVTLFNFLLKYRWKSMPFHVRLYTSAGMYSISNDHCTKFCSIEVSLQFTTLAIRLMNLNHCQRAEIEARTVCTRNHGL